MTWGAGRVRIRAVETPRVFGAHTDRTYREIFLMTKNRLATLFLIFATASVVMTGEAEATDAQDGEWVQYAQKPNGDRYFFDPSRVERNADSRRVWSGIRYKTSVMGASSFLSLLEIDCSERTERVLQSTFFTDKHWKKPAMMTNTKEGPKRPVVAGSETERLVEILCD
jgi:Surface-adhesin protein E